MFPAQVHRAVLLAVFAFTAVAQTPAKSGCALVTLEDAATVLGAGTAQHAFGATCVYDAPGQKLKLVVKADTGPHIKDQMEMPKLMVPRSGGTVKDEPGLGAGAYSTTIKGTQTIYLLKGSTGISVSITNDAVAPLPDVLDKLRPIAKKAAGRT